VVLLKEDLGILRGFTVPIDEVINASETRSAIFFMVEQLYPEDEGTKVIRSVYNYLPVNTVY